MFFGVFSIRSTCCEIIFTVDYFKGIQLPDFLDGQSFIEGQDLATNHDNRQILVEYWGEGDSTTYNPQCIWKKGDRLSVSVIQRHLICQRFYAFLTAMYN